MKKGFNMDLSKERYKLSYYNVLHEIGDITYMWNTYANSLLALDESGQKYIQSFSGIDDNSDEFKMLKENGFVVNERVNEFARISSEEKQALFSCDGGDMSVTIAPGMGCNYECSYCFQTALSKSKGLKDMTPEIANEVAAYVCKMLKERNKKRLRVTWFGGEPLLYIDIIEIISNKIFAYVHEHNIDYSAIVITNGRLLDENAIAKLVGLGVKRVQITIDGLCDVYCSSKNASPEDFRCVINNIRSAADKFTLTIRMNISGNDAKEAIAVTNFLSSECNVLDKVVLYFAFVRDHTLETEKQAQAYIDYVRNYFLWVEHMIERCGMSDATKYFYRPERRATHCGIIGVGNACIDSAGNLYRCHHGFGDTSRIIGDIWNGKYFDNAYLEYYSAIDAKKEEKCSQCKYLPIHMSGCVEHYLIGYSGFDCETYQKLQFNLKLLTGGCNAFKKHVESESVSDEINKSTI